MGEDGEREDLQQPERQQEAHRRLRFAVLIPARDEAETLPTLFAALETAPPPRPVETVVVDNGSSDDTAAVARRAGANVVREPVPGYGRACLRGLAALRRRHGAALDAVVFLDADDARAPAQLPRLLRPLASGDADLSVGERVDEGPGVRPHAAIGNRLVSAVLRGLYGSPTRDLGPFRAVRWSTIRALRLDHPTYGWYVQMQVRALRAGYRVRGVPVRFERRARGHSKVSGSLRGSLGAGGVILATLAAEALRTPHDRGAPG